METKTINRSIPINMSLNSRSNGVWGPAWGPLCGDVCHDFPCSGASAELREAVVSEAQRTGPRKGRRM